MKEIKASISLICIEKSKKSISGGISLLAILVVLAVPALPVQAQMDPEVLTPVPALQDGRLEVTTAAGSGIALLHVTRDWSVVQPGIQRAVIVIHGWPRRDLRSGEFAATRAGANAQTAIVITPQFLIQADVTRYQLPPSTLRWGPNDWAIGRDAIAPARISSFEVLDAILQRLADRQRFPDLREVVIAGHSAGGRFAQHYAAVEHGEAQLLKNGIHIRYVVANPSAYLYLNDERPVPPTATCTTVNRWEYGLGSNIPRYVQAPLNPQAVRERYFAKDIIYLLGTADNDPHHHQLDRSCAAEAQGPTRFQRGLAYVERMKASGALHQSLLEVPGVGHHSSQMFASTCGVSALFGDGSCGDTPQTTSR
ncbi:alpha/beta hydrolase [Herbaspirillum rubrisubalbicans]|uniref:Alpha/beta hydrolase n=1 Tax=Herbaspirillum rubrisubalbicans Os34 TaxID=1235827 RepID=A0A6M3ZV16_9BURK|nr:alpha/beta hydrolase [Herbaspirillum rubrisubalbicans]QJQ02417.1 alpha/beta hydrolase [Herbaspirillum rubrisubalbicans Os34]